MYGKPFKMMGKSPMMKKLVGKQNNLPAESKANIKASPATKKPTLGEWFKSTKLGKNLKSAGKIIKEDSEKVSKVTEGVTSRLSKKTKENKELVKTKVDNTKKTIVKGFKNSTETRKKNKAKRTAQFQKLFVPKKKKA